MFLCSFTFQVVHDSIVPQAGVPYSHKLYEPGNTASARRKGLEISSIAMSVTHTPSDTINKEKPLPVGTQNDIKVAELMLKGDWGPRRF